MRCHNKTNRNLTERHASWTLRTDLKQYFIGWKKKEEEEEEKEEEEEVEEEGKERKNLKVAETFYFLTPVQTSHDNFYIGLQLR